MGATRLVVAVLLPCALVFAGACGKLTTAPSGPLPAVSPEPSPHVPAWIAGYSPRGSVSTLSQIRIEFKAPLIPLESLESEDERAKLAYFAIEPALPGRFRFLTPRLVGFQADAALPVATRVRVTIKRGITDLRHNRLDADFAWTFDTPKLKLTPYIVSTEPQRLDATLRFSSNAELDAVSLEKAVTLESFTSGQNVPVAVTLEKSETPASDDAEQKLDPSIRDWLYDVKPQRSLDKAGKYRLVLAAGMLPAHGNIALENARSISFVTFSPLRALGVFRDRYSNGGDGASSRFYRGDVRLKFNNPVNADSARANISIAPTPKPWADLVRAYDGSATVALDPAAFDPNRNYAVTIHEGLTDIFGQTLGKQVTLQFNPGDLAPDFWAPAGLNIFPSGSDLALQFSAVNLPREQYAAAYRVVQPADLVYADPTDLNDAGGGILPDPSTWPAHSLRLPLNRPQEISVPLQDALGSQTGMLAYGTQAQTNFRSPEPLYYGAVQMTNLGVFAQWFPASGLVRVHHLTDGSPSAGARVDVYPSRPQAKSGPPLSPCASANTDAQGTARFSADALSGCMRGGRAFAVPPELLAVAHEGADWSFARTYDWSGEFGYGIYSGWDDGRPQSKGTIFSDRDLYQQGESGWLTGVAFYTRAGVLHRDVAARYHLTMEDADGNKTELGAVTTDAYGLFARKVTLAKNQPLGYYAVRAKSENGVTIDGQFRVAQFRPPNFKVELKLDKEYALPGDAVNASSQSNYLFGPPVEGGKAAYYVTRSQTYFSPKGWDDYSFGRRWEWPENPPSVDTDVVQNTVDLGSDGVARQRVDVASDLPYPMRYQVDVDTTDVSNLSVADSKSFTALPSDRLIGLKTDWVAQAKRPISIGVIVTDPGGKAQGGQRVHVTLQRIDYAHVMQVIEGGESSLDQVEYKTVAQADARSDASGATVQLTPPIAGSYRIRANFADAKSDATASDAFVWATGLEQVFWAGENPDQLQIKLDKPSYKEGEWATALIESPYPDAELYFAVIRHDTLYHAVTHVHGGAPTFRFRVTANMLPNAAVEALLVRTGKPLARTQPGTVESLSRIGFAPFEVNVDGKRLKVAIAPGNASVAPGDRQTVQLTLRDAAGEPARGEFAVAVANEAVLQLGGYRLPDLVSIVYADQDVVTRFADNRPNVVLRQPPSPIEKGWGYGGGLSAAAAGTRVRTNFQPLAYFNGAVHTDANGHASIAFAVPDDLTTWRVMAVAAGETPGDSNDFHFGTGDATFVTTKPLAANPLLPQFARPGDAFQAGVSVTNARGASGQLAVDGTLSGALRFDESSGASDHDGTRGTLGSTTQAYRFPMVAGAPGDARVSFALAGAGMQDAFAVSIPIVSLQYLEQVVDSGVTVDRAALPIAIDKNVRTDEGGLRISMASTLLPDIVEPAHRLLDEECLPFAEPAATQLAIAADVIVLQKKYGHVAFSNGPVDLLSGRPLERSTFVADRLSTVDRPNPAVVATRDLDYLNRLQNADGGFGDWPGDKESDPEVTAYAAQSLAAARNAGIAVDPHVLARVRDYLHGVLANPSRYSWCVRQECINRIRFWALQGLSALGETRDDFLSDIHAGSNDLAFAARVRLARYLLALPAWKAQGRAMAAKLRESVYDAGRTATVNVQHHSWWDDSLTTEQALALRLMIDDRADPQFVDRMVQGLLALRHHGTWSYGFEDAQALAALIDYGATQPAPPHFDATASLELTAPRAGSTPLGTAHFAGYAQTMRNADVPMSKLPPGGRGSVILRKSGAGTLHYFVDYSYTLAGPQPGIVAGLRVLRYVRPANQTTILWQSGLAAGSAPLALGVGQVFDVELEVIADHPVDGVVITDPLPAGLEAVDATFQTSTPHFQAATDSWQLTYQSIYRDRVVAFGDHLDAGDYSFHYLVRSVTPGTFSWPGAEAHLQYAPEIFGRTASGTLVLK